MASGYCSCYKVAIRGVTGVHLLISSCYLSSKCSASLMLTIFLLVLFYVKISIGGFLQDLVVPQSQRLRKNSFRSNLKHQVGSLSCRFT